MPRRDGNQRLGKRELAAIVALCTVVANTLLFFSGSTASLTCTVGAAVVNTAEHALASFDGE